MDSNPSPGNKAGGITTILEKSLGAVAKGGHEPGRGVDYAEPVHGAGFVFMDTPGYDPVSATGQVAGGANLICFTTGRGSVFGSRPAPRSSWRPTPTRAADVTATSTSTAPRSSRPACRWRQLGRRGLPAADRHGVRATLQSEDLALGGEDIVPRQIGAVL